MNIINLIKKYNKYHNERIFFRKAGYDILQKSNIELKLTKNEINEVKNTWPIFSVNESDMSWYKIYKEINGFDSGYVTDYFYAHILKRLNGIERNEPPKSLYDVFYKSIPFPETYLRNVEGLFYDRDMNNLDFCEAVKLLGKLDSFIIKPSIESGGGKNVKKIELKNNNDSENETNIQKLLKQYDKNYVVQEVIKQDDAMSRFNKSSINTYRITTIYMNDKMTYSTIFKCGNGFVSVDNWVSGVLVGVTTKGELSKFGYDCNLKKFDKSFENVKFEGEIANGYGKLIEMVTTNHKRFFSNIGIIGWDVCLRDNEDPCCLELNITWPGIFGEQLVCGPFLKDRKEEFLSLFSRKIIC